MEFKIRQFISKVFRLGPLKFARLFHRNVIETNRRLIGSKYLRGSGIEIGALHAPMWVGPGVDLKRVDRFSVKDLRSHYPELAGVEISEPDLIDDGEKLDRIQDGSLDFIVANHFLEHCENFLGTLRKHLSKLKSQGVLFYAIPNKRYTFDFRRQLTSFSHLISDDQNGPETSRKQHYQEWAQWVDGINTQEGQEERVQTLMKIQYSIHFHVWDYPSLRSHLRLARDYLNQGFEVKELKKSDIEMIVVLTKY